MRFARWLSDASASAARRARAETPFAIAAAQATAPDFVGLGNWFNSAPLKLADLRGKVVLVNFWTYGCVNCVNTLPHVTELYAKYKDRGLVVSASTRRNFRSSAPPPTFRPR